MWNEKSNMMKRFRDPDEIRKDELETLRESLKEGNQVEVRLVSISEDEEGYSLIGKYGESGIDVLIADADWFPDLPTQLVQLSPLDLTKIDPKEWVRQQATGSMGGLFSVLLTEEEKDSSEPLFYASRLKAMEEDRRETFFAGNLPKVDDQIAVRVVNATPRNVKVEAAGVECVIPRSEMSWIFKTDCQQDFPAGTVLEAVITKIKIHPDSTGEDGTVDLELSVKRTKPFYDAAWKYNVGDRVLGTVISQVKNGMIVDIAGETTSFVSMNGEFTRPLQGQQIVVEIIGIAQDSNGLKRLSGIIKTKLPMREVREIDEKDKIFSKKAEEAYLEWLRINKCVPIDLAYKFLTSYYYYDYVTDKTGDRKMVFCETAADRIIASLRVRGIRNDGDGCHHHPRNWGTINNDPKADRLLRLSEVYQIFRRFAEPEAKMIIPTEISETEVLTILRGNGEVESVAVIPDGDDKVLQNWINDQMGTIVENLNESSPKEDRNYWRKYQARDAANEVKQIILAENQDQVEKIRVLNNGENLLKNSQVWILNEETDMPGRMIEWNRKEF